LSRKIAARELLAALGGLLVLISLFLEWYTRDRGFGAIGDASDQPLPSSCLNRGASTGVLDPLGNVRKSAGVDQI
jgi:hypothetical protein